MHIGCAVRPAQPAPVDHGVALADVQRAGHTGAGLLAAGQQRLRLRQQPAPRHLLGVAGQPARRTSGAGHERAPPGNALQQSFDHQRIHRLSYRHAGDPEPMHQLTFGRCR